MKEKIRPIYSELQGYLSQAPEPIPGRETTSNGVEIVEQLNSSIEELEEISGDDYSRYKENIKITKSGSTRYFDLLSYRSSLGGLISRLHGKYFSDENPPFSGMPSTVINQNQSQITYVQVLLEMQSKIDSKIPEYEEGTRERSFLEKVKSSLSGISDINSLVVLILKTAKDLGLTLEQIFSIFS
ncbi:hypothetical protein KKH36_03805 [Patescibacteria group bacterium]|nr:hypothetical protein [Patescibacteria group bacterium]